MKDFLKKVISGNGVSASDVCLKSFDENFKDAINVDWYNKDSYFEAVFYKNNLEHIAIFNLSGLLMEYRQNLPPEYLPEPIRKGVLEKGEIMNSVLKNKGNMIEYEIILRTNQQKRYMLNVSDIGELIEEKAL